ncbi:MAG: glycosyltransferase family 39 protein [Arcicella sp.]|nr:glycosyltransferase family 39 protein [Arcicella sp.]
MFLILLTLITLFYLLNQTKFFSSSIRYNFIITLQIFALLTLFATEALSFFNLLTISSIRIFWGILFIFLCVWLKRIDLSVHFFQPISTIWKQYSFLLGFSMLFFCLSFLCGILYAPINYDSLSYHLPRIEYWLQHQNVTYYATQTDRNLYQPPLAEYMILQIRAIDNADYFDFFVQWIFGIGSCVAVSQVAQMLFKETKTQWIAFLVSATIPMLILQSGTTQNDLVHAFFIITALLHFQADIHHKQKNAYAWAGLAIGQAILTKGTAYIFLLPICIWWGVSKIRAIFKGNFTFQKLVLQGLIIVILWGVNIAIFYFRNTEYIGSPLGVSQELYYIYNNQSHSVGDFISVLSRNMGLHFGLPGLHKLTEIFLLWFHDHILHVPLNNSATSFTHFDLPMLSSTEDSVSCFLHFVLLFPTSIYIIRKGNVTSKVVLLIAFISFFIFCYVVKFQIWHIRLHLPFFLLFSPLIADYLSQSKIQKWLLSSLIISGIGYALFTFGRPLIKLPPLTANVYFTQPRSTHYYTFETDYSRKINAVIEYLKGSPYKVIGIKTDDQFGNDPIYPIMYELRGEKRFVPVQVTNESKKYQDGNPSPDCVIYFTNFPPIDTLTLNNHNKYHRIPNNAGNLLIFVSENQKSNK